LRAIATSQLAAKPSNLFPHDTLLLQHGPLSLVKVLDVVFQMSPRHGEVEHKLVGAKL
jgi:hypothetical protein